MKEAYQHPLLGNLGFIRFKASSFWRLNPRAFKSDGHSFIAPLEFGRLYDCDTLPAPSLYEVAGSIVPGVAYHWANNTAAYVLFHVYHNPQSLQDIVGQGMRPALMALLFSLCILLPALFQLHQRMRRPS